MACTFKLDKNNKPSLTVTKEDVDKIIKPLLNPKFLAGAGCFSLCSYIIILLLKQEHEKELLKMKFEHEEKMKREEN